MGLISASGGARGEGNDEAEDCFVACESLAFESSAMETATPTTSIKKDEPIQNKRRPPGINTSRKRYSSGVTGSEPLA